MANVKVFADKQTDRRTNREAKNYMSLIYRCIGKKRRKCWIPEFLLFQCDYHYKMVKLSLMPLFLIKSFRFALIKMSISFLKGLNPFPKKGFLLHVCHTSPLKTLWKMEKLLVPSKFSFSHRVFLSVWRPFCHFHQI